MPTVHLEAELSAKELLDAVGQLEPVELNRFIFQVLALRARKQTSCLSSQESDLLNRINRGLPQNLQRRVEELNGKRQNQALAPEDHAELLRLIDELETLEAERAQALVELSQLRGLSLTTLMQNLGITLGKADIINY